MNTRPHCRTSPPIGIGGPQMPGGITTNSRTGFAASRPSAGFRIPSWNCWISPGGTMPEHIGSAGEPQTDDRRTARVGLVGDGRPSGDYYVAANAKALAASFVPVSRCSNRQIKMAVNRPAAHANRARPFRPRTEQPSRRDRASSSPPWRAVCKMLCKIT
jgi:hypothetical protein